MALDKGLDRALTEAEVVLSKKRKDYCYSLMLRLANGAETIISSGFPKCKRMLSSLRDDIHRGGGTGRRTANLTVHNSPDGCQLSVAEFEEATNFLKRNVEFDQHEPVDPLHADAPS